jgi:voltage-gated potassium channel Kch
MLAKVLLAWCLLALCVAIHAAGLTVALPWLRRERSRSGFWRSTALFVRIAAWMIVLHVAEVSVWAVVYHWGDAIRGLPSALYFSAVTYTTTGYGDLVLPEEWRLVGAVEALTGILMCGWSTGFFFATVSRMNEQQSRQV